MAENDKYYVVRNLTLNHHEDYDELNVWIESRIEWMGRGGVFARKCF
jgi:hypothetical protein